MYFPSTELVDHSPSPVFVRPPPVLVHLLPLDSLDVHAELLPVALHDLAELLPVALRDLVDLLTLVVAAHHLHLVVLADRHRAHAVLLTKVLQNERFESWPESKLISSVPR